MFCSRQSSFRFLFFLVLIFGICSLEVFGAVKETETQDKSIAFSQRTLAPFSGNKPDSIVVLFHGYGDTAENFMFLSVFWAELLPNTLFVAVDAPTACKEMSGKKWFKASNKDRSQLLKEINLLTVSLNRYLDGLLKKYNIPPEKMALVGFSQGARVALHVGLRRPCAGVIAFSGSYLDDTTTKILSRPPILIIHGLEDKKAPSTLGRESHKRLEALKVPVTLFLMPGIGHEIDPRGSGIAGEFLQECLSGKFKGF